MFVPFGNKKAVVNLKHVYHKLYKRFSRLCADNIIYYGGHLHDWQEDVLSEKEHSGGPAWYTWHLADARLIPSLLSSSYLVQNQYTAVDKSELTRCVFKCVFIYQAVIRSCQVKC